MAAPTKKTFTIGTRSSKLALLQTDLVQAALQKTHPDYEFKILSKETAGDLNTSIALRDFTTKNLWTEELEELMIAGKVDFIVHSLKGNVGRRALQYPAWWHETLIFISPYRCTYSSPRHMHIGPNDAPRR